MVVVEKLPLPYKVALLFVEVVVVVVLLVEVLVVEDVFVEVVAAVLLVVEVLVDVEVTLSSLPLKLRSVVVKFWLQLSLL